MDLRRSWLPAAVSALIAIAVYANTLGHGFVIDDIPQVKENPWLDGAGRLPEIFTKGVWDFEGRVSSYYRPAMYGVYLATALAAGRSPAAFHAVNVAVHALACAAAAFAAAAVARRLDGRDAVVRGAAWVAGIGFAVHPIHTEAGAWIAGMADLGFGLFSLAAIALYASAGRRAAFHLAAAACYLVAMLFKEPAVLLPLVLVAIDAFDRARDVSPARLATRFSAYAGALAIYLALRIHALGGLAPTASDLGLDASAYARAVVTLAGRYLAALVWPFPQSFWHAFEIPDRWTDGAVLASATAILILVVLLAALRTNRLALWGLLAILPPLLPALALRGLNQGLENAFAERYLYLPTFGFLVALGAVSASAASRSARAGRLVVAGLAVVAVAGAWASVDRNAVWRDHLHLWADAASKAPRSGVAQQNLGFALLAAGRGDEAQGHLRRALELRPDLPELARAKAEHYERVGLPRKAVFSYLSALTLRPGDTAARWGLARQYVTLGWTSMAEAEYRRVLGEDPGLADAQNELGILLAERGETAAALERFEAAARLRPGDPDFAANAERARRALADPR